MFLANQNNKNYKKICEEDRNKLFILKPLYQRSVIVAAGPLANFVLAILIFIIINMICWKRFDTCNN